MNEQNLVKLQHKPLKKNLTCPNESYDNLLIDPKNTKFKKIIW